MDGELLVGLMEAAQCETVLVGTLNSQFNGVPAPEKVELGGSEIAEMLDQ